MGPLAAAGYRVVAPNMRGYNLSSRPKRIKQSSATKVAGARRLSAPRSLCGYEAAPKLVIPRRPEIGSR